MALVPPRLRPLVLIVDDNEKNRKLARDVLRAGGLRTIEAADGHEASRSRPSRLPDVILLDLRLPDMDGMEVARALRDGRAYGAYPGRRSERPALRRRRDALSAAGFAGYLEKPIDVRAFPGQVRELAAARRCASTPRTASEHGWHARVRVHARAALDGSRGM